MKIQKAMILLLIMTSCLTANAGLSGAAVQSKTYQQMSLAERGAFVSEQARRLARQMSGRDYQFTPSFEAEIQKSVDFYARRIGNGAGDPPAKGDYRLVFERGQTLAPTLSGIFKAQNVSPLIGLYLPLIESAYVNIPSANSAGAIGMFQFLPKTGAHFGLSEADLLDVSKSADAAARYIAAGLETFKDDPMKEALALLAYNRGGDAVEQDLATLVNAQNRGCSICVLTEQRDKLDANFQKESVYYVPRFFAAAIVGENPQAFGLQTQPLSSL
jgi:hypothetical protein